VLEVIDISSSTSFCFFRLY